MYNSSEVTGSRMHWVTTNFFTASLKKNPKVWREDQTSVNISMQGSNWIPSIDTFYTQTELFKDINQHTCWLKPCFSSITNVLYRLQGSPVKALNSVASVRKTRDWVISCSAVNPKRAARDPAMSHRNGIPPSSRISWKCFDRWASLREQFDTYIKEMATIESLTVPSVSE